MKITQNEHTEYMNVKDYRKEVVTEERESFISQNDQRVIRTNYLFKKYICCYLGKKICPMKFTFENIDHCCRLCAPLGQVDCDYVLSFVPESDEGTKIISGLSTTVKLNTKAISAVITPVKGRKTSDRTEIIKTCIRNAVEGHSCNTLKDILDWINAEHPELDLTYKSLHPIFTTIAYEFDVVRKIDGLHIKSKYKNALCSGKCSTCSTPCELYNDKK